MSEPCELPELPLLFAPAGEGTLPAEPATKRMGDTTLAF